MIMKGEMLNIEVHDLQGPVVCCKKNWTSWPWRWRLHDLMKLQELLCKWQNHTAEAGRDLPWSKWNSSFRACHLRGPLPRPWWGAL